MAIKDYKLNNLPRSTQLLFFAGLVVALVVVFYVFYLKELVEERTSLEDEVQQLETAVAQSEAVASQLSRFKREVAELNARLEDLRAILPAEKETPIVLRSIQQMAKASNLKIIKFTPQPVAARDFYSDWPIVVEIQGSYNALGTFFEKISQFTRIINVDDIRVTNLEGSTDRARTLKAVCTTTTFVFREEEASVIGN